MIKSIGRWFRHRPKGGLRSSSQIHLFTLFPSPQSLQLPHWPTHCPTSPSFSPCSLLYLRVPVAPFALFIQWKLHVTVPFSFNENVIKNILDKAQIDVQSDSINKQCVFDVCYCSSWSRGLQVPPIDCSSVWLLEIDILLCCFWRKTQAHCKIRKHHQFYKTCSANLHSL